MSNQQHKVKCPLCGGKMFYRADQFGPALHCRSYNCPNLVNPVRGKEGMEKLLTAKSPK